MRPSSIPRVVTLLTTRQRTAPLVKSVVVLRRGRSVNGPREIHKDHPRIICTNHNAGMTVESGIRLDLRTIGQVTDAIEGRAPAYMLNPEVLEHPRVKAFVKILRNPSRFRQTGEETSPLRWCFSFLKKEKESRFGFSAAFTHSLVHFMPAMTFLFIVKFKDGKEFSVTLHDFVKLLSSARPPEL